MKSQEPENTPNANPANGEIDLLFSIRSILLAEEKKRISEIERQVESIQRQAHSESESLRQQVSDLLAEQERLRQILREANDRACNLNTEVEILRRKVQSDSDSLVARITPVLGDVIVRSIHDSRDEMAEALGQIMGEAIRVQIRDSRKDMIEALYPVVGETVQRAVGEFAREFQRNIDARLRKTFGPQGLLRTASARLRGVSPSQLALRDALPFTILEIFLIQHGSGLLLAHSHPGSHEVADADLIGGMLTAIRDFAHDAFGQGDEERELDEIQYGDQRIIIQSGRAAYLAVVINGVEPEGFRATLRTFVSDLHVKHESALRQYNGDPSILPNFQPKIARLVAQTTSLDNAKKPATRKQKLAWLGIGLLGLLGLMLACFYLQFTVALYPIAFPSRTLTKTSTPALKQTASPTLTFTPTATSTPTFTLTPTSTPTNTPMPRATFTPSPTETSFKAFAMSNVWVRSEPRYSALRNAVLLVNTPVKVLSVYGPWVEVEWQTASSIQRGWVPSIWIALREPVLVERTTPTPTP